MRSQVSVAGPSGELGFGKGAAGTLQVIVAGHRSKSSGSIWSTVRVVCASRDRHSMQIGVEVYLHRDICIEMSASKRSERVFDSNAYWHRGRVGIGAVLNPMRYESNAVLIQCGINSMRC
jgi:hypothetical protein